MISPVEKGKLPSASAITARAISSGWPQRRIGVRPSAIKRSSSLTAPVMSVFDDAGSNFVHVDTLAGETVGKSVVIMPIPAFEMQLFAPIGAAGIGADGANVDDFWLRDGSRLLHGDHLVGDLLGEEKTAFQINSHHFVITGFRSFPEYQAAGEGHTGVVYQ